MNAFPKRNVIKFVCFSFAIIGIVALAGAITSTIAHIRFAKIGVLTEGTVTEMIPVTYRDSDGDTRQGYSPNISYITREGKQLTYYSNRSSYPPKYNVGETVVLRYHPNNPAHVEIKGEGVIASLVIWLFGLAFGGVGIGGTVYYIQKARTKKWLKKYGVTIQSDFVEVTQPNIKINGQQPYVIHSRADNPADKQTYRFTSEHLFSDPSSHIKPKQQIPVLIDLKNWTRYTINTSFLPQE